MTYVEKIESVLNMIRFFNGVLWVLMEDSTNISPNGRDYILDKMLNCISMLESLKSDMEGDHDSNVRS